MPLAPFFAVYIVLWSGFCLLAAGVLVAERQRLATEWRAYLRFLCVPWKLALFAPAFAFVTVAGRYTNDETWDVVTGGGMSILTFLTAPWSVGLLYQVVTRRRAPRYLVVALALLLFSSSWFYDGYLLWRDGAYTHRWAGNLMLSPIIYVAAGLLWNLEARERTNFFERHDFRLAFVRPDWPASTGDGRFAPLLLVAVPLMAIAAFVLVAFVRWHTGMGRP